MIGAQAAMEITTDWEYESYVLKEDFDDGTQVKVKPKKGIWKKVALVLSLISITIGIIVLVYMLIK